MSVPSLAPITSEVFVRWSELLPSAPVKVLLVIRPPEVTLISPVVYRLYMRAGLSHRILRFDSASIPSRARNFSVACGNRLSACG